MYHAQQDEIVPYGDAHKTARAWCRNGAQVQFHSYTNAEMGHFTTEITGSVPAFRFIRDLFNNQPVPSGCQFTIQSSLLFDPSVLGGNADEILDALMAVFGENIGNEARVLAAKRKIIKGDTKVIFEHENHSHASSKHGAKHNKHLAAAPANSE